MLKTVETTSGKSVSFLFAADGRELASYDGYGQGVWLSNEEFVAYRIENQSPIPESTTEISMVQAIRGSTRSPEAVEIRFPCCNGLGNGTGAVAVTRYLGERRPNVESYRYAIWQDGNLSGERDGWPLAWSPAGEKLVVLHPFAPTVGAEGWLEVVSWPGQQTIFEDDRSKQVGEARFDPSGEYVAYPYSEHRGPGDDPLELDVVALSTGSVARIPVVGNYMSYAWNESSQLVVSTGEDLTLATYSVDGARIAAATVPNWTIVQGSADGSTLVTYQEDLLYGEVSTLAYERDGSRTPIEIPEGPYLRVILAPDGDHLILVVGAGRAYLSPPL